MWIPTALLAAGFALAVVALARPHERLDETNKASNGIAIQCVVDRSSSMTAEIVSGNGFIRRIDIVKKTLTDFLFGNGKELTGRPDDLVGLICFARYADTLAPLSLSHEIIADMVGSLETVQRQDEDGTSIGDALALAAARLEKVDESNDKKKTYGITSRIIVLLTDGENNAGRYSPKEAAEMASKWGIKVYTIGFGGTAYMTMDGMFGSRRVAVGSGVDEAALKGIAEITGGEYFQADSAEDLLSVYETIDRLEKSVVVSAGEIRYRELFFPYALAALLFFTCAIVLSSTFFRRFP